MLSLNYNYQKLSSFFETNRYSTLLLLRVSALDNDN